MVENIYLFVPNIVGYMRVFFLSLSMYYIRTDPSMAIALYLTSVGLDEIDGRLARKLNQCSHFGAVLDLVTDKLGSLCVVVSLCSAYPEYTMLFQWYIIIDIGSHWFYDHSSLLDGKLSHKDVGRDVNPLLGYYYHNSMFMTLLCLGNEIFLSMLYLCHFSCGPRVLFGFGMYTVAMIVSAPLFFLKTAISGVQFVHACKTINKIDTAERNRTEAQWK